MGSVEDRCSCTLCSRFVWAEKLNLHYASVKCVLRSHCCGSQGGGGGAGVFMVCIVRVCRARIICMFVGMCASGQWLNYCVC